MGVNVHQQQIRVCLALIGVIESFLFMPNYQYIAGGRCGYNPTGAFAACAAPAAPLRVLLRSHFEPDLPSASPAPLQRSASATLPANVSLG